MPGPELKAFTASTRCCASPGSGVVILKPGARHQVCLPIPERQYCTQTSCTSISQHPRNDPLQIKCNAGLVHTSRCLSVCRYAGELRPQHASYCQGIYSKDKQGCIKATVREFLSHSRRTNLLCRSVTTGQLRYCFKTACSSPVCKLLVCWF